MDGSVGIEMTSEHTDKLLETDNETSTDINALDEYLYDLYESELKFQIDDNEVRCIQESVETLVDRLVTETTESQIYKEHADMFVQEIPNETGNIKSNPLKLFMKFLKILKVGSFYEGTRNNFPDEFDYVAILLSCEESQWRKQVNYSECALRKILNGFHEAVCHVVKTDANQFKDGKLQLLKVIKTSGPATKLEFVYKKALNDEHIIQVDLSPAIQLEINGTATGRYVDHEKWNQRVLKTGHYLKMLVYGERTKPQIRSSVVETELNFMNEEVTFSHKLAYKVLKHILSAHNEEIRNIILQKKCVFLQSSLYDFSSYKVKTLLYQHTDKCVSDKSIGYCCTDMLTLLLNSFQTERKTPYIKSIIGDHMVFCYDKEMTKVFENFLKDYIKKLKDLQNFDQEQNHKQLLPLAPTMRRCVECQLRKECCCHVGGTYVLAPVFLIATIVLVLYGALLMVSQFIPGFLDYAKLSGNWL